MSHTIRLRDPWQQEQMSGGGMRWLRAFHCPTGLSAGIQVWLVISGPTTSVWLDDRRLLPAEGGEGNRFEITHFLARHHRLAVEVSSSTDQRAFDVSLEIVE